MSGKTEAKARNSVTVTVYGTYRQLTLLLAACKEKTQTHTDMRRKSLSFAEGPRDAATLNWILSTAPQLYEYSHL